MNYRDRRALNITLFAIITSIIIVVAVSVLTVNAVVNHWGFYQIFTGIGTALVLIGGFGVYTSFAGGAYPSNTRLHAMYPEMAMVENRYARERRRAFPLISFIILGVAIIFLVIGLVGLDW
ncbi:MAG: hypothetical protein FK734_04390 [Asgard group archaeon]|nr:hypothetical protein [Asgard group archaeon]